MPNDEPERQVLEPPDAGYAHHEVEIDGVPWIVPCGLIFCLICDSCMACSDDECWDGEEHEWPPDWEELCRRVH